MTVSIDTLKRLADKLPAEPREPVMSMAVMPEIPMELYRHCDAAELRQQAVRCDRITFRAKITSVEGVRCTAWYYHDLLVKVCV